MEIEKVVDFNAIQGMEFHCECGGTARVEVDDEGILCDVSSPNIVIRVLMKPVNPGEEPWTAWHIREDSTA